MNPAELNDVMDAREKVREQGLRLAFRAGEMIPLKGIWFQVSVVEAAKLTLTPQSMTKARAKEVHGG